MSGSCPSMVSEPWYARSGTRCNFNTFMMICTATCGFSVTQGTYLETCFNWLTSLFPFAFGGATKPKSPIKNPWNLLQANKRRSIRTSTRRLRSNRHNNRHGVDASYIPSAKRVSFSGADDNPNSNEESRREDTDKTVAPVTTRLQTSPASSRHPVESSEFFTSRSEGLPPSAAIAATSSRA